MNNRGNANSYFVKEYSYIMGGEEHTGTVMKIWDGNEPYYFFREVAKSLYGYFMQRHRDMIKIIVWKGVLYEYVNPEDVFKGIFTFRSPYGYEKNIVLDEVGMRRHFKKRSA